MLQSMRLPRVGHSLETEQQQRATINKQIYSTSVVLKFIELRQWLGGKCHRKASQKNNNEKRIEKHVPEGSEIAVGWGEVSRRRKEKRAGEIHSDWYSSQEQKQLPQKGLLKHVDKRCTKNHQGFKANQHHGRQASKAISTSVNAQGNSF